jgi:aryl-alcohol dehydrogenase-like predicted oxidoreductase
VLAQGEDIVPIPGTTRVKNLEENVSALDVELSDEELRDLEAVFPKGAAAGDRYADMSAINR